MVQLSVFVVALERKELRLDELMDKLCVDEIEVIEFFIDTGMICDVIYSSLEVIVVVVECVGVVGHGVSSDYVVVRTVLRRQHAGIFDGVYAKIMQKVRDIRVVVEVVFDLCIDGGDFDVVDVEILCHVGYSFLCLSFVELFAR